MEVKTKSAGTLVGESADNHVVAFYEMSACYQANKYKVLPDEALIVQLFCLIHGILKVSNNFSFNL